MNNLNGFYLFLIIFFSRSVQYSNSADPLDEVGPVVFVNVMYRHGARNPEAPYSTDPYSNISYWPEGWGELSNEGKLSHYQLGKWLGQRYSALIPSGKYSPDIIYVRSTDLNRTLTSALSNLAGMFPPGEDQRWGPLDWQPIPVHTVPEHTDEIVSMKAPCEQYDVEMNEYLASEEMKKVVQNFSEVFKNLSEYSGENITTFTQLVQLYNTLTIQKGRNLTIPKWAEDILDIQMNTGVKLFLTIPTKTKKLKRLRAGPLLKEMLGNMKDKRNGSLTKNLWIYSAHDTTIASFFDTIGVFEPHAPPFCATVLVELRKNTNNQYFVSVLYRNSTGEPTVLVVPGCTPACPLNKFEQLLQDVIPEDWYKECTTAQGSSSAQHSTSSILGFSLLVVYLLVLKPFY